MKAARAFTLMVLLATSVLHEAQDRTKGSIEGVVINELSGSPLQGAALTITPTGGTSSKLVTDKDGKFLVTALPPGHLTIDAARDGFYRPASGSGPRNVNLLPGEQLQGIRIYLVRESLLEGTVLDEKGLPKPSVTVFAFRPEYENGRRIVTVRDTALNRFGTADDQGRFRLAGLQAGNYFVGVWSRTGEPLALSPVLYPGVLDHSEAAPITIRPGSDITGLTFKFPVLPAYSVKFEIQKPPPEVEYTPTETFQIVRRSPNGVQTTIAIKRKRDFDARDAIGDTFILRGLARGSYIVYYGPGPFGPVGHLTFDVIDRDVDAGRLIVKPNIILTGHVRLPGNVSAVGALQLSAVPLDGRRLTLGRSGSSGSASVKSDGTFRFASIENFPTVSEGRYQLEIRGLPTDFYISSILAGPVETLDTGFLVGPDFPGSLQVAISGPGGTLDGEVRNDRGAPVGDATVVLVPAGGRRSNFTHFKTATTDQTGRYFIRGIPAGEYGVLAWESLEPGAYQNLEFLKEFEGRALPIRVRDSSHANLTLRVISNPN